MIPGVPRIDQAISMVRHRVANLEAAERNALELAETHITGVSELELVDMAVRLAHDSRVALNEASAILDALQAL